MSRPIAEIIGWKATTFDEFEDSGKAWVSPDGSLSDGPSVDDMRQWLLERQAFVALADCIGAPIVVEVKVGDWEFQGGYYRHLHGPTLYAAFEAAVRAVAGVGSEDTP